MCAMVRFAIFSTSNGEAGSSASFGMVNPRSLLH
jgi:hypothetical protein